MGQDTKIEWADHTFNPWWGCTKVSPGCAHCYAEGVAARFGKDVWGKGQARSRTSGANWRQPLKWNKGAAEMRNFPVRRPRVFCGSMCDVLDPEVPVEWLADLLDLIRRTPYLDWLLLTKRPELWRDRMEAVHYFHCTRNPPSAKPRAVTDDEADAINWLAAWVRNDGIDPIPENVWMGTSVEDQKRADERLPALLKIPARVRFLSCEPLLEEVSLVKLRHNNDWDPPMVPEGINWVIVGGESGPKARPMHPDWARALRDDCQAAGVAFFFKQWGDNPDLTAYDSEPMQNANMRHKKGGRLLDGRAWNGFPEEKAATDGRDGR